MILLHAINRYLKANHVSATAFGRTVMHDPRFVHELRGGRCPRPATEARVRAFLADGTMR